MEFLEVPLFDDDFFKLLVRFLFNVVFVGLIVGVCYYPHQKNKAYVFTFLLMNVMVFFICFTLKKLDLGIGMALGLFAIFAIIRYRTDAIKVKEMTYLFVVVGIAVINSLSNKNTSYAELLLVNVVITAATLTLEQLFMSRRTSSMQVVYDNVELLQADRRNELLADLKLRTGIDAKRVIIRRVDFKKKSGTLTIIYSDPTDSNYTGESK